MKWKLLIVVCLGLVTLLSAILAYTPPDYDDIELTLNIPYVPDSYDDITLTLGEVAAPPSDTCDSGVGNWSINSADNCTIENQTIELAPDGIYYYDTGFIIFRNCNLTIGFFERGPVAGVNYTNISIYDTNITIIK